MYGLSTGQHSSVVMARDSGTSQSASPRRGKYRQIVWQESVGLNGPRNLIAEADADRANVSHPNFENLELRRERASTELASHTLLGTAFMGVMFASLACPK